MRHGTVFGKNAGPDGAVGLPIPDGYKTERANSSKRAVDRVEANNAAEPVDPQPQPPETPATPRGTVSSIPRRSDSLGASNHSPRSAPSFLPSPSSFKPSSSQSDSSPSRIPSNQNTGRDFGPPLESPVSARSGTLKGTPHDHGADSEATILGPRMNLSLNTGLPLPSPPASVVASPAPSAYSRSRKQLARLSQQSSVTGSDASGDADYTTADEESDMDSPEQQFANNFRIVNGSKSSRHGLILKTVNDPFATIRERNTDRKGLLVGPESLTGNEFGTRPPDTLTPEDDRSSTIEVSDAQAADELRAPSSRHTSLSSVAGPSKRTSSGSDNMSISSSRRTTLDVSTVEETGGSGTFGYATKASSGAGGRFRSKRATPRVPSVACGATSPFAAVPQTPDATSVLNRDSNSQANLLQVSPTSTKPIRPPRSPSRNLVTAQSGSNPSSVPPTKSPPSSLHSRSPVQARAPIWPTTPRDIKANEARDSLSSTPKWYYNPTSPTGKRSAVGLGLVDPPNSSITSDSAVNPVPVSPNVQEGISDNTRPSGTISNTAEMSTTALSTTMSTSSLSSTKLLTLCPPSLSAVTDTDKSSNCGPSWTRSKTTQPQTRITSRSRSASASASRSKPEAQFKSHDVCPDCNTDSESSLSDEEPDLTSPHSPLDFSARRPGFVPSPPEFTTWSAVPRTSLSTVTGRNCFSPDAQAMTSPFPLSSEFSNQSFQLGPTPQDEETQKRSLDVISDTSTPQMSHSTGSHDTTFEVHSLKTPSPTAVTATIPIVGSAIPEDHAVLAPPLLDRPPSQFARASFGCDGPDAEHERAGIMSASVAEYTIPQMEILDLGSSSASDIESAASSDDEYSYNDMYHQVQGRPGRRDFFGSGSVASQQARRSHASLDAIPSNHEDLAYDLKHLQSFLLPESAARKSTTSIPFDEGTAVGSSAVMMPRQKSLVNLLRKSEENTRSTVNKPRKVKSTPKLRTKQTIENVAVVDNDREFHGSNPPSQRRMWQAGTSFLYDEDGNVVCFGDLFPTMPKKRRMTDSSHENGEALVSDDEGDGDNGYAPGGRTVIFFIRSFWCGLCQDYTLASIAKLDPVLLKKHNVRVAVIGPGHWKMLRPYRTLFKCPFPFYTDPSRKLYHTMGMIRYGTALKEFSRHRAAYHQASIPAQAAKGVARGLRHMPLGYNVGNLFQLGGEFVIGPGYRCEFAHRMKFFGDHMDAREVLSQAGVDHPEITRYVLSEGERAAREELNREAEAASRWAEERDKELNRMKMKKAARRIAGASRIILDSSQEGEGEITVEKPDDTRSEWGEYVQSVLNPDNRASYIFTPPVRFNEVSTLESPESPFTPTFVSSSQTLTVVDGGGPIPIPDGEVMFAVPRTRFFTVEARPEPPKIDTRSLCSPKPPYRPLCSPIRKPVPTMNVQEEQIMRQEDQRLSQVVAGLD